MTTGITAFISMARIAGIVELDRSKAVEVQTVKAMVSTLTHAPSYQPKVIGEQGVSLGAIGLEAVDQFVSSCQMGEVAIVAAGYLLNLKELSQDIAKTTNGRLPKNVAEVIGHYLAQNSVQSLDRLNGLWAFAAWNKGERTLALGVDRFGMRPLYYRRTGNRVLFASEVKGIAHQATDLTMDRRSVEDLLHLGFILDDRTPYEQITRVAAGTVVRLDDQGEKRIRYWSFERLAIDPKLSVPEFCDQILPVFKRTIARGVEIARTPICMLSCGYDSRRIILELAKHSRPHAYTSAVQMTGEKYTVDVGVARALCQELGLEHSSVPLYDPSMAGDIGRYGAALMDGETNQHRWIQPLLREVPVGAGVNFDGLGGDILLYGKHTAQAAREAHADPKKLAELAIKRFGPGADACVPQGFSGQPIAERIAELMAELPETENRFSQFFFGQWTRRRTGMMGQSLMSYKFESIYPYLDNDYVELSYRLAPELKIDYNLARDMLWKEYPELMAKIPSSHDPQIGTNPDARCKPFVAPIPENYALKRRYARSMMIAGRVSRSLELRKALNGTCRAMLLGLKIFGRALPADSAVLHRLWRLDVLEPLSHLYYTHNDSDRQQAVLQEARKYLFGGDQEAI